FASRRSDWVEILEPRSRRRMYVNLSTGECGWEPPRGIAPRPADGRQWWELFDVASGRFYYYDPVGRRTVWHRPRGCDIVPLARLQAAKLGSEAEHKLDSNRRETPPGYPAYGSVGKKDTLRYRIPPAPTCHPSSLLCSNTHYESFYNLNILLYHRDVSQRWQPVPGSKANTLMKVHSMGRSRTAGAPGAPSALMLHQRRSSSSNIAVATPCGPPAGVRDTGRALRPPTPSVRSYAPCCPTGSSLRMPRVLTSRAESPRPGTEAPPTYDEPPVESPVYDEPPADMEVEGATSKGLDRHAERSPSDYSPAGRACIRHMVNVELPPPRPGSPPPATPLATPTQCQAQQRETARTGRPSWRGLEDVLLRGPEGRHSRQGSLASQELPYRDSDYSTRPSPGLRRKSRRRPTVAHGRAASAGARELGVLNERLVAEMRARASRSSLGAEPSEGPAPRARSPPRSLHVLAVTPSSKDGVATGRASQSRRHGDVSPAPTPAVDAAGGHKRTYEKVDTLEKSATSQISLSSPESPSSPSQVPGVATLDSRRAGGGVTVGGGPGPSPGGAAPPDSGMADWATKHLNLQKRGIFRRRVSLGSLLSWSSGSLRGPMLITSDRAVKREACQVFRLVQAYMGDRAGRLDRRHTALLLVTKCWALPGLRDELYVQLVRQTTHNLRPPSLAAGWELMAICLGFFAPSPKFRRYLEGYIQRHLEPDPEATDYGAEQQDVKNKKNSKSRKKRKQNTEEEDEGLPISMYAKYCYRRLQKVALTGGKKGLRKPTLEEVDHFRSAIETPSLFGSSLQEVMERQRDLFPDRRLPWVQVQLSQYVLALGGTRTEGIFRVPGDIDEVNALKLQVEQWRTPENLSDPNVPASLLKLWYRELEEPLIPPAFYSQCIGNCEDPTVAIAVVQSLPELSRLVLCYFIHFLQIFAQPANVSKTKMDVNNLAMVMAPNCLRCQSEDPRVIFENTRKEMAFLRLLIVHLDTSFMKGVV
uniref:Rho GTPase-activating protein 39 n=1 Tax=Scleropages formosus TaxID=113540 RepID=A0A8C9TJE9_SCLFO